MKRVLTIFMVVAFIGCAAREPYERNTFYTFAKKHPEEKHQNSYKVAQGFCVYYTNAFEAFNQCMDYQLNCYKKVDEGYLKIISKKGELYTATMIDEYYRSREDAINQTKGIDHCDLHKFIKKHLDVIKRTEGQ